MKPLDARYARGSGAHLGRGWHPGYVPTQAPWTQDRGDAITSYTPGVHVINYAPNLS